MTKALLGGRSPQEVASSVIKDTRIDEPRFLRTLIEGGPKALERCQDPLILLAARIEPRDREVKRLIRNTGNQVCEQNVRIAKARYAAPGPDCLSGCQLHPPPQLWCRSVLPGRRHAPAALHHLRGLFDRADAWGPLAEAGSWALPAPAGARRQDINPSIPLNFITTNDIIGGNSGSPVVDRDGELVGLVFDGNIQSIPGRFYYDDRQNRCLAVDARAILEALAKVYDADHLVRELTEN